ncbi:GyrI-like domain-containing protein, partial [Peterkaempfera griseoplana]|uniref:GyrI-like domain-containing protein n=1 Tax=Peterkaempfera griseoplana TaxID=66896 RepID=UPI0006E29184
RAELAADMAAATARLAQVEARLRAIESEGHMPATDVVLKAVPAVRIAELSAVAASYGPEDIGPVLTPLYDELFRRLARAGITPTGPGVAWYEDAPQGDGAVIAHAGVTVAAEPRDGLDVDIVDLPPIRTAATAVHRGSMDHIVPTGQAVARWIDANGYRSDGYAREVYLECPQDRADWVTEIQEPVVRATAP